MMQALPAIDGSEHPTLPRPLNSAKLMAKLMAKLNLKPTLQQERGFYNSSGVCARP